ncbi:MAG: hypothetical protein GTN80_06825, partial [Nitrososphaeria archaeon]|nr:hypothetical protein [Nitrososphaeria archaeon]
MEVAEKYTICPRTLQKMAMEEANLIFAPYNYMVIPRFPITMENLRTDFYIIDEAHNLDVNLTSMQSNEVAMGTIDSFFRNVNRPEHRDLSDYSTLLIPLRELKGRETSFSGKELTEFMGNFPFDELIQFMDMLDQKIKRGIAVPQFKVPRSFLSIKRVLETLVRLSRNHNSGIINVEGHFIKIQFVDTDVIFAGVATSASR